ncbi:hypothetical protein TcasGA2_TC033644 [Tribolium castaneum]|uniref:Uncharacterized protein n=1 Tax=Tribolium castaneum TaxID=7070 RepID=A0A139WFL9_TRICA|nr:hypothetical protein TcasGA2_TC033644 [Tribolium castaneum]
MKMKDPRERVRVDVQSPTYRLATLGYCFQFFPARSINILTVLSTVFQYYLPLLDHHHNRLWAQVARVVLVQFCLQ